MILSSSLAFDLLPLAAWATLPRQPCARSKRPLHRSLFAPHSSAVKKQAEPLLTREEVREQDKKTHSVDIPQARRSSKSDGEAPRTSNGCSYRVQHDGTKAAREGLRLGLSHTAGQESLAEARAAVPGARRCYRKYTPSSRLFLILLPDDNIYVSSKAYLYDRLTVYIV